jgi:mercuric ion transport protein
MKSVELIFDATCPNVEEARARIRRALNAAKLPEDWREWRHEDPDIPEYAKAKGSPTILVDGRDVAGEPPFAAGDCCRIYPDENGKIRRTPDEREIIAALEESKGRARASGWSSAHSIFLVAPALLTAALPKLTCPACWPAYFGLLAALGVGFVNYTPYLFPLTVLFLFLAVLPVAKRAPAQRYGPLLLGGAVLSALSIVLGKFLFGLDAMMYTGLAVLTGTAFWSAVQARKSPGATRR